MTSKLGTAALVVLSGGQDSTTCLFWALQHFDRVHTITFDYNQRHVREVVAARDVAEMAGIRPEHQELVALGPILKGRSPLTNPAEQLETYNSPEEMAATIGDRVELTFVPMRNALFLTIAANRAACLGTTHIVTGVCQEDNANYPDCRASFIDRTERMIAAALGLDLVDEPMGFTIHTPLMDFSKAETVLLAAKLPGCMDALAYSHTAYSGEYPPITQDHATVLRAKGFLDAGLPDPLIVRAWREGRMELPDTVNYDQLRNQATA